MTRCLAAFAKRFASDRSGATAIEYGLIAGMIFLTVLGAATLLSGNLGQSYDETSEAITSAGGG